MNNGLASLHVGLDHSGRDAQGRASSRHEGDILAGNLDRERLHGQQGGDHRAILDRAGGDAGCRAGTQQGQKIKTTAQG